jgi:hypothetical protein
VTVALSAGERGQDGVQGDSGVQGATGSQGATGATGSQGVSGTTAVTSPLTRSGSAENATIGLDTTGLEPAGLSVATKTELSATIGAAISDVYPALAPILSPSEVIAQIIDFGAIGRFRGAIAGDSTMNDGNDPPRKLLLALRSLTPEGFGLRENLTAGGSSPTYGTVVTVRAGESTADVGGAIMLDNFNRTGELAGSTSSGGQVWLGSAGTWSGNGAQAVSAGTTSLAYNVTAKTMTTKAEVVAVTSSSGSARQLRVYGCATTASPTSGGNYAWAMLNLTASGIMEYSLWARVAGINTQVGATIRPTAGVATNSATPVTINVELNVAVQAISGTFRVSGQADQVISGTISESDVGAMGNYAAYSAINSGSQLVLNSAEVTVPFTAGSYRGLDIYNASVGGTSLDYQANNIAALYPSSVPLDFLYMTQGHNSATLTATAFVARLDAFVTAFRTQQPNTPIMVGSQNPQFAPATTIAAHAANQRVLRAWAMGRGFEYLPVFEAFTSQADAGLSLVNPADGIHPTVTNTTDVTTWCGNLLIASVWLRAIRARRRVETNAPITTMPS